MEQRVKDLEEFYEENIEYVEKSVPGMEIELIDDLEASLWLKLGFNDKRREELREFERQHQGHIRQQYWAFTYQEPDTEKVFTVADGFYWNFVDSLMRDGV